MAQQTTAQARVIDPILTNHARGYRHPQRVAEKLFPRVPVNVRGGQVIEFGKESFRRCQTLRAPGASTKRIQTGFLGKPFALKSHSLEGIVPTELQDDASQVPGVDLGREAVDTVLDVITLSHEYEAAQIARAAGNYDADHKVALAGSGQWDHADAKPAAQVREYSEAIRATTGMRPNVMVLSAQGYAGLRENPSIIDRFKYTSSDSVTAAMLAKLFDLDEVVIGESVYADGPNDDFVDVWGKDAVLAYVPRALQSQRTPSYGYTYALRSHPLVEQPYAARNEKSWVYPVTFEHVPVLTAMGAGFLIQNCVS